MFQNMKMYKNDNKTDRNFITKKYFSKKVLIFPDSRNQNSQIKHQSFNKKEPIFEFLDNSLIFMMISRLAVSPVCYIALS